MPRFFIKVFKLDLKWMPILILFLGFILPVNTYRATAQISGRSILFSITNSNPIDMNASYHPSISSDGRFITFIAKVDDVDKGSGLDESGLFLHDRLEGKTVQLNLYLQESSSNSIPMSSRISANGRFIATSVLYGDHPFINNDSRSNDGIILYDLFTGETHSVSISTAMMSSERIQPLIDISGDGRFTTFPNQSQLTGKPGFPEGADILIYDQIRDHYYGLDVPNLESGIKGNTLQSKISDNGRIVIYRSNIFPNMIGTYNRVTAENTFFDYSDSIETGEVVDFDISSNGNILAFIYQFSDKDGAIIQKVYLHNYEQDSTKPFTELKGKSTALPSIAISGNGNYLVIYYPSENDGGFLNRYEINTGSATLIDIGRISPEIDISYDGDVMVYTKNVKESPQVFIWDAEDAVDLTYILAGRVTDPTGHPLSLVTIQNDQGQSTRTDGDGIFWFNDNHPGRTTLRANKEGYIISPVDIQIEVNSDHKTISFVYAHRDVLKEAQKDLGMPYSFNRGESGPFHGFSAGYCTDLILDAYTWGVDYNIQFALEQDYKAHPWHFYRWRDARNAHDMWRYFSYSDQMQPHSNPYQPGDIVFFDWSEDGEIDHVAIVSEVSSQNRPKIMLDATGVINSNPSGLAAELPWEDIHERTVRGFARWSGRYEPIIPDLPPGQVLQIALGGAGMNFRLIDSVGKLISATEVGIQGGRYDDWTWEKSISIDNLFSSKDYYLVVIHNPTKEQLNYQFTAQFTEDGMVSERIETKGALYPGEIKRFPLVLDLDDQDKITLNLGNSIRRVEGWLYPHK